MAGRAHLKQKFRPQLLMTLIPASAILMAAIIASFVLKIGFSAFTRDTAAIAGIHPLAGFLSNMGILLWGASFFISLFTAITLRNFLTKGRFVFLISSALLSGYLMFDDFFMFHEFLAPKYLGLNDNLVLFILVLAAALYLYLQRRMILKTDFWMLVLALTLLAFSVFVDVSYLRITDGQFGQLEYIFEEGPKWLGIACWCSYHVQTAYRFIKERLGLGKSDIETNPSE